MVRRVDVHSIVVAAFVSGLFLAASPQRTAAQTPKQADSRPDAKLIEQLTGAKGQLDEKEGVFKVSAPRTDLQVTAAGVKIPTSMGLTSWAAFEGAPGHTMVMGDLCLTEDQVNRVMSTALDNGLGRRDDAAPRAGTSGRARPHRDTARIKVSQVVG